MMPKFGEEIAGLVKVFPQCFRDVGSPDSRSRQIAALEAQRLEEGEG
jgi:hypothetical protein